MADGGKVVIKIDGDDSGFKKATSGLGKFASGALKGIAVGATAIGTAIIGIGTASIKAYAEYEQLAGGMETLFGARGAKTVEEYAKIVGSTVDQVGADFEMLQEAQKQRWTMPQVLMPQQVFPQTNTWRLQQEWRRR